MPSVLGTVALGCPKCGTARSWVTKEGLMKCGTLFHRSHLPLRTWFCAMWWVTNQKHGLSALGLQRLLGLGATRRLGHGAIGPTTYAQLVARSEHNL